ncbi:MAG: hypothetical protein PHX78_05940 [bacterium]|nr:hypothetical protein [bacterium]
MDSVLYNVRNVKLFFALIVGATRGRPNVTDNERKTRDIGQNVNTIGGFTGGRPPVAPTGGSLIVGIIRLFKIKKGD